MAVQDGSPDPAIQSMNQLISRAQGPLQQHLLPHLTADAMAALWTASRATHQLLAEAPIEALRPALQTLLPPQIRCCATSTSTLQALLSSQVSFKRSMQMASQVKIQPLQLRRGEEAERIHWAPEFPCKSLLLECKNESGNRRCLLLDPSMPGTNKKQPISEWLDQQQESDLHYFLQGGYALLGTKRDGTAFALLDMSSLSQTASWSSVHRINRIQASEEQRYIVVEQSVDNTNGGLAQADPARSLLVVEQPSLCQKHELPFPELDVSGQQQQASMYCMELAPDDQHLAVLWNVSDDLGDTQAQSFSIYAMSNGQRVADFDTFALLESLRCSPSGLPQTWWSPDSSMVLIRTMPAPWADDTFECHSSPVLLCKLDQSFILFDTIPKPSPRCMSWSPDGQYIHLDCWPPGEDVEMDPPDYCSSRGTVFRAADGEKVFEWNHPDATEAVAWSAEGCCLFIPSCQMLVGLPSKGVRSHIVHQPWKGPKFPQEESSVFLEQPVFVPAPAGRVLVGAWQSQNLHPSPSSRTTASRQAFQLWHLTCDLSLPATAMTPVATSATIWLTTTIAWHPGPRTAHIYAIATACGSLHLMDAKKHRCLHTWKQLAGQQDTDLLSIPQLSWSSDGTQLLSSSPGGTCLLTFNAVEPKPAGKKRAQRRRNRAKQAARSSWLEVWSEELLRFYYYNPETREVSLDQPAGLVRQPGQGNVEV